MGRFDLIVAGNTITNTYLTTFIEDELAEINAAHYTSVEVRHALGSWKKRADSWIVCGAVPGDSSYLRAHARHVYAMMTEYGDLQEDVREATAGLRNAQDIITLLIEEQHNASKMHNQRALVAMHRLDRLYAQIDRQALALTAINEACKPRQSAFYEALEGRHR